MTNGRFPWFSRPPRRRLAVSVSTQLRLEALESLTLLSGVLVFTETAGFRHGSIPDAIAAVQQLGAQNGFDVAQTEDPGAFTDANLSQYQAVIFLLTTGDVLDADQQAAFERYIEAGNGWVGVHSAADTGYDWPWYGQLMGAYFQDHPDIQTATIHVAGHDHPSTLGLPDDWVRTDEWYNFQTNPRDNGVTVLATLDESTYMGGTMGDDHPIMWYHEFDGGRAWYTAGGHTSESYYEPLFVQSLLGGIEYAMGNRLFLTATPVSSAEIDLAWTDLGTDATGYRIERSLDNQDFMTVDSVPAGTTSYNDIGLDPGTQYFYRIVAMTPDGDSPYSNPAQATTFPLGVAPGSLLPKSPSAAAVATAITSDIPAAARSQLVDTSVGQRTLERTGARAQSVPHAVPREDGCCCCCGSCHHGMSHATLVFRVGRDVTSFTDTGLQAATAYDDYLITTNQFGNSPPTVVGVRTEIAPPVVSITDTSPNHQHQLDGDSRGLLRHLPQGTGQDWFQPVDYVLDRPEDLHEYGARLGELLVLHARRGPVRRL
jgi:type 1 glutamine amidotransferase